MLTDDGMQIDFNFMQHLKAVDSIRANCDPNANVNEFIETQSRKQSQQMTSTGSGMQIDSNDE
jgi:hypothetical protein